MNYKKQKRLKKAYRRGFTNYVFMYTEWTCWSNKDDNRAERKELLSIGLIVTDIDLNIIDRYYSLVKPIREPILSDFCKEFTGINQLDIEKAPSLEKVIGEVGKFLSRFNYDNKIYVWGRGDKEYFTVFNKEINSIELNDIKNKLVDAEVIIGGAVRKVWKFNNSISLTNMMNIQGINNDNFVKHNALMDAEALRVVFKAHDDNVRWDIRFLREFSRKQVKMEISHRIRMKNKRLGYQ